MKAARGIRVPKISGARFHQARPMMRAAATTPIQARPCTGASAGPRAGRRASAITANRKIPTKPTKDAVR